MLIQAQITEVAKFAEYSPLARFSAPCGFNISDIDSDERVLTWDDLRPHTRVDYQFDEFMGNVYCSMSYPSLYILAPWRGYNVNYTFDLTHAESYNKAEKEREEAKARMATDRDITVCIVIGMLVLLFATV